MNVFDKCVQGLVAASFVLIVSTVRAQPAPGAPATPPGYAPQPGPPGPYWGPQPSAPPTPWQYAPPAPQPPPPPPIHDGFFLRFGMGMGMMDDSAEVETFVHEYGVNTRGGTLAFEVSIGGGVQPGIAIAGTYLLDIVVNPRVSERGTEHDDTSALTHDLLGATIDIYPNPFGGFHAGMTVGYATLSIDDEHRDVNEGMAEGIGFAPHVGYGWWSSDTWSLGLLGRFRYSRMEADVNDGLPTGIQRDSVVVGTVELAATLF